MNVLLEKIQEFVKADDIRTVRYDPLQRIPFFREIEVPEANRAGEPFTIVRVKTADEIARILTLANTLKEPVYVRQSMGIVTPDVLRPEPPGSVILEMSTMKWIKPNLERNYVEIGPSVTERELNEALEPLGFALPELIGPVTWASLIGLNSSGRSVDPYIGKPRDYVLGLQAVLPTGEIVQTGTHGMRKPCGFDLTQLLIGAQCLFGVVTEIRLRLVPARKQIIGAVVHFPSLESFGTGVASIYQSRAPYPRLLEVMDQAYMTTMGHDGPISAAMALLSTDGDVPGEANWKMEELLKVMKEAGATQAEIVSDDRWAELLAFREAEVPRLQPQGMICLIGEVLDCPLDNLAEALAGILKMQERIARAHPGVITYNIGHIGGGSFHPSWAVPLAWGYERLRDLSKEIREEMLEFKLSYKASVGEQGVFPEHRDWFAGLNGQIQVDLVNGIKKAMDPNNVLNPHRLSEDIYA